MAANGNIQSLREIIREFQSETKSDMRELYKTISEQNTNMATLTANYQNTKEILQRHENKFENARKEKWTERIINGIVSALTAGGIHFGTK